MIFYHGRSFSRERAVEFLAVRRGLGLAFVAALFAGSVARAVGPTDDSQSAPNVDVRWSVALGSGSAGARSLGGDSDTESTIEIDGMTVTVDPLFGTANYVRRTGRFLGFGQGTGAANAEQTVRGFIDANPTLFEVSSGVLDEARVIRDATTAQNGMRSLAYLQTVNGLDVFNAQFRSAVVADGELVFVSSQLLALGQVPGADPVLSGSAALAAAAAGAGYPLSGSPVVLSVSTDADQATTFEGGTQSRLDFRFDPTARLVYFPLPGGEVKLAWWVVIFPTGAMGHYANAVDAQTGDILLRQEMWVSAATQSATYRVFAGNSTGAKNILDSPTPFSPGSDTPSGVQPGVPSGQPALIPTISFDDGLDPQPSPDGWLDDGATDFGFGNGNNVNVFVDRNLDNFQDVNWPVEPDRNFALVIDPPNLDAAPSGYINYSMMQLFYTMNFCHDRFYMLGFDEAHGNFQRDNFGRGGLGDDAVTAVVQHGADFASQGFSNNASFSTPGDGSPGFLSSLVFTGPSPDRDSALDAEIMIHEYTHGATNRIVDSAFGFGLFARQSGGMGEGWSDFIALSLLAEPGDDEDGVYAKGGYSTLNLSGVVYEDNYYYGIRRYPYSTDTNKNPLTFADIDPAQFSVPSAVQVPRNPVWDLFGLFDPAFAEEVHNQGEVWCSALWECRANLIKKLGFAGNELMMQLVIDGLKLTPPRPTFIDARDAIFLADQIRNDGANLVELALGFAKRGMGGASSAPPANTTRGVVESFSFPAPEVALRATVAEGSAPLAVTFHAAVVGLLSDSALIQWDFGDGSVEAGDLHRTHVYSQPGSYVVRFVATFLPFAGGAASADATTVINVTEDINTAPTARITAEFGEGSAPISVIFRSGGTDPDGRIILHEWSFGDGGFATGEVVVHNYENDGTFLIRLTVTDDRGGKDFTVRTITIGDGDNALATGDTLAQPNPTDTGAASILPTCGAVGVVSLALMLVGLSALRFARSRKLRLR